MKLGSRAHSRGWTWLHGWHFAGFSRRLLFGLFVGAFVAYREGAPPYKWRDRLGSSPRPIPARH